MEERRRFRSRMLTAACAVAALAAIVCMFTWSQAQRQAHYSGIVTIVSGGRRILPQGHLIYLHNADKTRYYAEPDPSRYFSSLERLEYAPDFKVDIQGGFANVRYGAYNLAYERVVWNSASLQDLPPGEYIACAIVTWASNRQKACYEYLFRLEVAAL